MAKRLRPRSSRRPVKIAVVGSGVDSIAGEMAAADAAVSHCLEAGEGD